MRLSRNCAVVCLVLCGVAVFSVHTAAAESLPVAGRIVDYLARPVEGAKVILYSEASLRPEGRRIFSILAETASLPDGRFTLTAERQKSIHPNTWWLIAYKSGLAMSWTTDDLGDRDVVMVLGKPTPLGGVIVDEAGRPVAGAKVSLCVENEMMDVQELLLPGPEEWHMRRTDDQGRFFFDNLPPDTTADFQTEAPGWAPFWTFSDFEAGTRYPVGHTDIRIVLPARARIEGRVVDEDTGQAVSDVRVLAKPQNREDADYCPAPATVDSNGRFVLAGLTAGSYLLQAIAPKGQTQNWFSQDCVVTVQAGETVSDVRLAANQGAILEAVLCQTDSDAGVEGGRVNVSSSSFQAEATTDANGLARLRVPGGEYSLAAGKPEYGVAGLEKKVLAEKGQACREQMYIRLLPVRVSGTVVDPQGRPVTGASVVHFPFGLAPVTDSDGRFEYLYYTDGSASEHAVWIHHQESGLGNMAKVNDPSGQRRLTGRITLQPGYALIGRVTDPNGRGIPAAYVRLILASLRRSPHRTSVPKEIATDANGFFEIRGVPALPVDFDAHYYVVAARAPGYNETSVDPVPLAGPVEEPIRLKTLVLQPADQSVSGVLVDANGKPVAGAMVETQPIQPDEIYVVRDDVAQPHRQTLTDAHGQFRIEGVCKGPVELAARASSSAAETGVVHTTGGKSGVKIILGQNLIARDSLLSTRVTNWAPLGLSDQVAQLEGKAVLLCFVDPEQRSCRHVLSQLAAQSGELANQNVVVVGIPVSQNASAEPRESTTAVLMAKPASDPEATRKAWGIQSLPWLVLMDRDHVVRAEGFALADLQARLGELAARQ
ncbi:MAG: carboxypeptidase regulatory-like domain-containing protein [Solirubrobacterales bacterium]